MVRIISRLVIRTVLEYSIKNSFTEATSIIMNGSSDNNKENQLLVNSLEGREIGRASCRERV